MKEYLPPTPSFLLAGVGLQDKIFVIMLLVSLKDSFKKLVVAQESLGELPKLNSINI